MSDEVITWTNSTRKLRDLTPQKDNPRQIKKAQAERLIKSWHKFGQPAVISIQPDGTILNGHQRYHVWGAAYGMDCEVAVRIASRELTRAEWQELTVLMHEGATGEWDWDLLAGWDGANVEELVEWGFQPWQLGGAGKGDNVDELWQGMPEFEQDDKTAFQSIYIHFKNQEAITEFARLIQQSITLKTRSLWYPEIEIERYANKRYSDES